MKYLATLVLAISFLVSCTHKENSTQYLHHIHTLIENNDFYAAKFQIDSIKIFYPQDVAAQREGISCLRKINVLETQRNLNYCQQLLLKNDSGQVQLKKNFIFEPSAVSGLPGRYIHKSQTISKTYNRSYIRGNVDQDGRFFISSHYCAGTNINHTQIKVSAGNLFVITDSIPLGGGFNRRFDDGSGTRWEVVIYNDQHDGGVFNFIAENKDKVLKVDFIGKKTYRTVITDTDKKAIMESQQLSQLIQEHAKLETEQAKMKSFLEQSRVLK